MFSEVIRNISRVNNVLQELIKNYEQLQNMSKANSLEEKSQDYSSDSEIDEVYKNLNQKRKLRSNNDTTPPATKKNFPGTEMIVSEEEQEDITEKSNFDDNDQRTPSIQRLQAPDSEKENKVEETESSDDSTDKNVRDHKHSDEVKVPDNVFADNVHSKDSEKKEKSMKTKKKESAVLSDIEMYSTTKVSVQGNARNVQQVLHAETFQKEKIWDEIAKEKPIELKAHRNMPYNTENDMRSPSVMDLRSKKTAIVIVAKNKVCYVSFKTNLLLNIDRFFAVVEKFATT